VFIVLAIWLLPKIWRGVRAVFRRLSNWLSPQPVTRADPPFTSAAGESSREAGSGSPAQLQFTLGTSHPDSADKDGAPN
jgi:hypothetical protein